MFFRERIRRIKKISSLVKKSVQFHWNIKIIQTFSVTEFLVSSLMNFISAFFFRPKYVPVKMAPGQNMSRSKLTTAHFDRGVHCPWWHRVG